jgi:K+-sensing histidine kinase KdpD
MKTKSRPTIILTILFGYIILQFLWWEVLLVTQNGKIINEKQKIVELMSTNPAQLKIDIAELHHKKNMQTLMIVGEGSVFLLLLLFGIYKINQAQKKERDLNAQQRNFFLSITHELKTPIAATKLQLQTLQKKQIPEEIKNELISNALVETERLNSLIDNVLIASRIDSGAFLFHLNSQNISELSLKTLNRYYKKEIENLSVKIKIEENVFATVDEDTFPSILTNLIDNALKYSPTKKEVLVQLKSENNKSILSITDCGLGIDTQEKQKIFTKFYRIGNEDTRNTKGTGLGLYIVNTILKNHNSKITVLDNKPNGTIFEIQFSDT